LKEDELNVLNRMVTAYLELAELQALNRKPMYMKDWRERLDDFVRMTGNNILQNAGTISHQQALKKANAEYEKYKEQTKNEPSEAEKHFVKQIETTAKKLNQKSLRNRMRQINDIPLFVGVKEQYTIARSKGMKIVCALNRANGFVTNPICCWMARWRLRPKTPALFVQT